MAKKRYISTSFWDDEWIQSLSFREKYLYIYLLTNTLTTIAGIYKITIKRIMFDTGLTAKSIIPSLEKYKKDGKAEWYNDYIIIPGWPDHQNWKQNKRKGEKSRIEKGIIAELKKLPEPILKRAKEIGYRYPIDTISIPYTYPSNYSDSNQTKKGSGLSATASPTPLDKNGRPIVRKSEDGLQYGKDILALQEWEKNNGK